MNKPVQHHFLGKNAYLRFFESPEKEEFVYMYQRGSETIHVNIDKVAKERHLYSFVDKKGERDTVLETGLTEIEEKATPILQKLNEARGPVTLTVQEKVDLSAFFAMQAARTPAFRNALQKQYAELVKLNAQIHYSDKDVLERAINELRAANPDVPDVSIEEIQKQLFEENPNFQVTGNNYFLKQAMELAMDMYPAILMKDIFILKSDSTEFITSDHPVALIRNPEVPPHIGGGFLMAGVLIPIGSKTTLLLKNPPKPKEPPTKDEVIQVGYKDISQKEVADINKVTMNHAERFLYGPIASAEIKEEFDKTSTPKRFIVSSPFSKK